MHKLISALGQLPTKVRRNKIGPAFAPLGAVQNKTGWRKIQTRRGALLLFYCLEGGSLNWNCKYWVPVVLVPADLPKREWSVRFGPDMCGALAHVHFGPQADVAQQIDVLAGNENETAKQRPSRWTRVADWPGRLIDRLKHQLICPS